MNNSETRLTVSFIVAQTLVISIYSICEAEHAINVLMYSVTTAILMNNYYYFIKKFGIEEIVYQISAT